MRYSTYVIDFPPFHFRVLEAGLDVCRAQGLYIAGGYAVKAHGLVERPSQDLDFATDSSRPLDEIVQLLADAYRSTGFEVTVLEGTSRMVRLVVADPESRQACEVDVLKEPLQRSPVLVGTLQVVSLDDVVGMKTGALQQRGLPRDFIDVAAASKLLPVKEIEQLARVRTDEFRPRDLVMRLESVELFDDELFTAYGLDEDAIREIRRFAFAWAEDIKARRAADGDAEADFDPDITEVLYRG